MKYKLFSSDLLIMFRCTIEQPLTLPVVVFDAISKYFFLWCLHYGIDATIIIAMPRVWLFYCTTQKKIPLHNEINDLYFLLMMIMHFNVCWKCDAVFYNKKNILKLLSASNLCFKIHYWTRLPSRRVKEEKSIKSVNKSDLLHIHICSLSSSLTDALMHVTFN